MKFFLVVADGFDSDLFAQLKQVPELEVHPQSKLTLPELEAILPRVHGLVVRSSTQVNSSLLEKAPQLKYVIRAGEGVDNIDVSLCKSRGIKVANTPGANSNSAAELSVALMLTLLRKTAWAHQSMQRGEWEKTLFMGQELTEKTVGIVGFGRIGQLVAKRLQGFDPKILFYDPVVEQSSLPQVRKARDLAEIFRACDIVTVHTPYMPATHHLIGRELLGLMPGHAWLVNASRGNIVDEEALFEILRTKKIRGAALDVFAKEPLEKDSKWRELPNVILSPHLGASTEEAQFRVGEICLHQIREFFVHNRLINEVK